MLTAAALARATGQAGMAPVNAVSHVVWGGRAFMRSRPSVKYTLAGISINFAGCLFWAGVVEQLILRRPLRRATEALALGSGAAAAAYFVDYHCLPRRYRPGYERRLSDPGLVLVYAALALAFPLRGWLAHRRCRKAQKRGSAPQ